MFQSFVFHANNNFSKIKTDRQIIDMCKVGTRTHRHTHTLAHANMVWMNDGAHCKHGLQESKIMFKYNKNNNNNVSSLIDFDFASNFWYIIFNGSQNSTPVYDMDNLFTLLFISLFSHWSVFTSIIINSIFVNSYKYWTEYWTRYPQSCVCHPYTCTLFYIVSIWCWNENKTRTTRVCVCVCSSISF